MKTAADTLTVLLPVLYALAAANSVLLFVSDSPVARRTEKPLLGATVLLHAASLALLSAAAHRCPLGSVFEAMGLVAFSVTAVYLFLTIRAGGSRPTGVLILPISFLLALIAAIYGAKEGPVNPALSDPWFSVHAAAAVFGVSALAVSFVHGVFYLLQYRQIKAHRFGLLFRKLPPLAVLNRMTLLASVVGWALLTITLAVGFVWGAGRERAAEMPGDPLMWFSTGTWLLYSAGLGVRYLGGRRGRYTVYLSVCGFALLLVSMLVVSILFPGLHGGPKP